LDNIFCKHKKILKIQWGALNSLIPLWVRQWQYSVQGMQCTWACCCGEPRRTLCGEEGGSPFEILAHGAHYATAVTSEHVNKQIKLQLWTCQFMLMHEYHRNNCKPLVGGVVLFLCHTKPNHRLH